MGFGRFLARVAVLAAIAAFFSCQQAYAEGIAIVVRCCGLESCGKRENASLVVAIVFACPFCPSWSDAQELRACSDINVWFYLYISLELSRTGLFCGVIWTSN